MSTRQMSGDYRPDIDGLRAIAVLAVMIFHGHSAALPGGFLGVDIFFVISGYLISKHIAAEVQQRRFSLIEFYRRRVRRIMPMMLVVVAVTLPVSFCIMTPEDGRAVAKSTVWSIASMANIHFWRDLDTGYFADSTAEVPLLHLWSLGVEEQFYIIWPLLLMFGVSRLRPPLLFGLMVILAGLSFELAAWVLPRDASFAYYMLPTRMGELLIGALVGVPAAIAPWRLWPRTTVCSTGWLAGRGLRGGKFVAHRQPRSLSRLASRATHPRRRADNSGRRGRRHAFVRHRFTPAGVRRPDFLFRLSVALALVCVVSL